MFLASVNALLGKPQALSKWLRPITAAGLLCAFVLGPTLTWGTPAEIEEVNQLLASGKTNEAARIVQKSLRRNGNDVQMRFLQGVIAVEQKKYDQAIYVFTSLAKDYPNLPEPYNNLAVLYAAKGDDRKAAQVLEQAIRTNPSYATAHQNLGDLYARMATDAYAKALQLDNVRQPAKPQLSTINKITPSHGAAGQAPVVIASAAPAVTRSAPTPTAPTVANEAPTTAVNAPSVNTSRTVIATASPKPAEPSAQPSERASASASKAPATSDSNVEAVASVKKAVATWARAWEQQNMSGYYAAYSSRFAPQGTTLDKWKVDRKNRIVGKPAISVDIEGLKVSVKGDHATASFRQRYKSGGYRATTGKTLEMRYEGGAWRITKEKIGR